MSWPPKSKHLCPVREWIIVEFEPKTMRLRILRHYTYSLGHADLKYYYYYSYRKW